MENYVYLVIFKKEGELDSKIVAEGFILREKVETTVEIWKERLYFDYDDYEVIEPIDVMKEGGICSFSFNND